MSLFYNIGANDALLALFFVYFFTNFRKRSQDIVPFDYDTTLVLRGIAMLGIIIHHANNLRGISSPFVSAAGYLGTGLFFFISGYGNTCSMEKNEHVEVKWILNKLKKILIPYLFTFFMGLLFHSGNYSIGELIKNFSKLNMPWGGQCGLLRLYYHCFLFIFL